MKIKCFLFCFAVLFILSCKTEGIKQREFLYVGTYSLRGSEGLYVYEFDRDSLDFTLKQTIPELNSPNFLEIHPSGKYLYALGFKTEAEGKRVDQINAFLIDDREGTLELINQVPAHGTGACHVHIDKSGTYLFISFYRIGSFSAFKINQDGSIGDTIQTMHYEGSGPDHRQDRSHVHSSLMSPDNKYIYIADLGTDKIMINHLDQNTGKLTPASDPWALSNPGSGPRHMIFHPKKPYFYLAEELSSTVTLFYNDPVNGKLSLIKTFSTLAEDFLNPNSVADIHTDTEGNFLYVSNRGHNSLAIFSINQEDGNLTHIDYQDVMGDHPRNFSIEEKDDYLLVANMNTDNVRVFKRDKNTGLLQDTFKSINIPAPVCLKWNKL